MAESGAVDRLQPALLDRLTDDHPGARNEAPEARVLSRAQLRAAVLRDLSWLLNASRLEPDPNSGRDDEIALWRQCEAARSSVVNFGMPAFSGVTLASMDLEGLREAIVRAIVDFEPRIDPTSISVELVADQPVHQQHNVLRLEIRGNLWSQPVPLELLLRTEMDIETGLATVRDARA